ncbi:hypothetical protein ACFFHH_10775 [Cytobacillus solani]|uniref:Uncharacterized protein n=1 Tax=Cytobacillus solani TaxID=1637975 RepID=A0A0Q3VIR7_9BACI|nr:hypothetical protein [Cytobacillus solani]KOP83683.1 hypothetical protein AMS60_14995 [Bacillus sp. FJAT-21945]KQL20759.1 hypothetical protein AN957_20615 [Cytobacillus solani]
MIVIIKGMQGKKKVRRHWRGCLYRQHLPEVMKKIKNIDTHRKSNIHSYGSIYSKTNQQTSSTPLIYPPPVINRNQLEHAKADFEYEHEHLLNEVEEIREEFIDPPVQRKEKKTSLLTPTSPMIRDTRSTFRETARRNDDAIQQENNDRITDDALIQEYTDNSYEEPINELIFGKQDESSSIQNNDSSNIKEESPFYSSLLEEASPDVEFIPDESSFHLDQLLEPLPEQKELPTILERISSMLSEVHTAKEQFPFLEEEEKVEEEEEERSSLQDRPYLSLEESSIISDDTNESSHFTQYKNTSTVNTPKKIVKFPVLLAKVDINTDIWDSFDLLKPTANVTKIEWSSPSLDCHILFPSDTLLLNGTLMANIEYVKDDPSRDICVLKIPFLWKKTANIHWISPPILPIKNQREFLFSCPLENEISTHETCEQVFADDIEFELRNTSITWHKELSSEKKTSFLHIKGSIQLSIDLLQKQYIDVHSL